MAYGRRGCKGERLENRRILVDTSIIIDYLRKVDKSKTLFWKLVNQYDCLISSVTVFELYSGAKNDEHKKDIETILSCLDIVFFDTTQAKLSAEIFQTLKKQNNLIEFRDIFIASCAMTHKVSLATFNVKHFIRVDTLNIYKNA